MKFLFALVPLIALAPSALGRPTNSSCSRRGSKHSNSTSITNSTLVNSDASEKWSTSGGQGSWNASSDSSPSGGGAALSAAASAASAVVVAPSAEVSSAAAVVPSEASSTSLTAGAALATGSASDSGSSSSSVSAVAAASTDPTTSSAAAAATSSAASSADINTLLSLHNNLRAQYGASAVTWNDTLAAYAQADASTCVYGHTGGPYGENIAAIGGSGADITGDFNLWANEAAQYDWNNPGYNDATGHFTQIVWKATTQIGCGWQTCGPDTIFQNFTADSLYLVCEYMARGNVVDANNQAFIDNVGTYGS
ncbi:hypothetical protein EHS25_007771 [Saitozyma podzolica]|uniref:SCP domain-containing protein n=1 Tax=Saitozyma podzolica TaxID=1890683 RepID=A0A427YQR9_9TREE|nr:hypothetical protein EHS25_007771 [Saitozyma podzolica]